MKVIFILLVILFIPVLVFAETETEDMSNIIKQQLQELELNKFDSVKEKNINSDTWEIVPEFNIYDTAEKMAKGDYSLEDKNFIQKIFSFLTKEILINANIMIKIIIISVICGVLTILQSSFEKSEISKIAFFVCYIYIVGIMIGNFAYAFNVGNDVIQNMIIAMQAMVPILSTAMITTGNIASAAILQPSILFMVQIIAVIVQRYFIPILYIVVVLTIVNNISEKKQLSKFTDLLKDIVKWGLCFSLTVFIGILSIQGFGSAFANGVGNKTAKFFVGNFIPVVGSILSDAVEVVFGCSAIVRNAVGVSGLIILILICLVPLLKIIALILIYKVAAAIIEPISDEKITNCVSSLGDIMILLFAVVITIVLMFMVSICIMICSGNISTMIM
jgi:stage III sporulation protein AE